MDRIEQKIDETLKMLSEDPPETLGNQVMASLRSQKPARNRNFVWIGLVAGCALAVAVTAGVIFSGPKNDAHDAMTSSKVADESTKDSYGVRATPPADSASGANGATGGAGASERAAQKGADNDANTPKPEAKTPPKPESRPGKKDELEELNRPVGIPSPQQLATFPSISMTSVSADPWQAWAECSFQTNGYGVDIKTEILTMDDKVPNIKKTYKMTAIIGKQRYGQWLNMVNKVAGKIVDPKAMPTSGEAFNVTIIFEPKK